MGFSVSTSLAIVFFGALVAFGGLFTVMGNNHDRVSTATGDINERFRTTAETTINVTQAEVVNGTTCTVAVNVTNTGSTELSVEDTDLLVDGKYETGWEGAASVEGDQTTDVWAPGEWLAIDLDASSQPSRAKVVTETGVAEFAEIGGQTC